MDIKRSTEILRSLANGADPATGEAYPADSPYNQPEVIRALYACIRYLEQSPKRGPKTHGMRQADNLARGRPKNAGLPWTTEMRDDLATAFQSGTSPLELAERFERTRGSILAELQKQGLISEAEARRM
jgi:hypothetical protein